MHAAQGFGYPLPDLESPLFVTKLMLEDDADQEAHGIDADELKDASADSSLDAATDPGKGREVANVDSLPRRSNGARPQRIAMAVLLRLTTEAYLLHDPAAGTPRLRWQRFLALHEAARNSAAARGLDDVQAFLPPQVARAFGRRLERLGWVRDPWTCFSQGV